MAARHRRSPRSTPSADASLSVRPLARDDGSAVARLFGGNGACGGCWCMHWRSEKGVDWDAMKGAPNRRKLLGLIKAGKVHAVLAFAGEEVVGWCQLGPRRDFARLLRSRVMNPGAPDDTWAVTCFFIPAAWRGRGVGRALLDGAVTLAKARGARRLEGYPVSMMGRDGKRYASTFAFVGVPSLFEGAGFRDVTPEGASRPVYRRSFRQLAS
jgi:GNAT superfamily N-acetyltransferase